MKDGACDVSVRHWHSVRRAGPDDELAATIPFARNVAIRVPLARPHSGASIDDPTALSVQQLRAELNARGYAFKDTHKLRKAALLGKLLERLGEQEGERATAERERPVAVVLGVFTAGVALGKACQALAVVVVGSAPGRYRLKTPTEFTPVRLRTVAEADVVGLLDVTELARGRDDKMLGSDEAALKAVAKHLIRSQGDMTSSFVVSAARGAGDPTVTEPAMVRSDSVGGTEARAEAVVKAAQLRASTAEAKAQRAEAEAKKLRDKLRTAENAKKDVKAENVRLQAAARKQSQEQQRAVAEAVLAPSQLDKVLDVVRDGAKEGAMSAAAEALAGSNKRKAAEPPDALRGAPARAEPDVVRAVTAAYESGADERRFMLARQHDLMMNLVSRALPVGVVPASHPAAVPPPLAGDPPDPAASPAQRTAAEIMRRVGVNVSIGVLVAECTADEIREHVLDKITSFSDKVLVRKALRAQGLEF